MLTEFHFLRPLWLALFVPLIIFLIWFARRRFEMRRWQNIIDPQLMPHVLIGTGHQGRRRISVVLALAGALMITALAGPAWQQLPQPVFRNQDVLIIALDLSRSMDTADIKPSRLARARFKITDILNRRNEGQTALIAYAAEPFVISPLTDDTQTIISQLPALTTDLMPSQGSRADRALDKAAELMKQSGNDQGHVLLVTDGVNIERTEARARALKATGIRISVLGVGTDDGGPIPGQGGFVKRRDGSIVITKLDELSLRKIAAQGGGRFSRLSANASDVDRLLTGIDEIRPNETEATDLKADIWREEGPWLLLPLLPLAALAFRRGVLAVWLFATLTLLIIAPVSPAQAFEWSDLWSRPDQRATSLFTEGDPAGAAELFNDPAWKGAAHYRAGRYEESLTTLDGLDGIESTYNRGNALVKLGRYDEAISAYEDVLEREPKHHDASYNRDLVLEQMQQQEEGESDQAEESSDGSPGETPGERQENPAEESTPGNDQQDTGQSAENAADGQRQDETAMSETGQPPENNASQPESADKQEAEQAAQQSAAEAAEDGTPEDNQTAMARPDDQPPDEDEQATEQWLRKIPDDPGGLLRRKFKYQYQQQGGQKTEQEQW